MNTNPFPSQSTASADARSQSRSRVKVAVFSVVAVHVAGLVALLLTQGCRQQKPVEEQPLPEQPAIDTNAPSFTDTNYTSIPPLTTNPPPSYVEPTPPVPPAATIYEVKSGDSFSSIATANHTTASAIAAANPGVDSRKLKIGQKLNLPAPGAVVSTQAPAPVDSNTYVVKSGDTLGKIASVHKTTVAAIKSLNGLATDQIKVGQKLKLPVKAAPVPEIAPPVIADPALAPAPVR